MTTVSVANLSRNVQKAHLTEIFGVYGNILAVKMGEEAVHLSVSIC